MRQQPVQGSRIISYLNILNESRTNLNIARNFSLDEIHLLLDYEKAGYGVLTNNEIKAALRIPPDNTASAK